MTRVHQGTTRSHCAYFDVNNNIPLKYVKFSKDIEAFNNYPWGHDNYKLTVKYLLDPLSLKTNNLFGCPWAFMACTLEVIPYLKHQVTAKEEISSPRILRCLTAKNVKNSPNLFNPPDDALVVFNEDMVDAVVRAGVIVGVGVGVGVSVGVGVGAGIDFGGQSVGATSCGLCFGFLCEKCKKHEEDFIKYLQTLSQAVNEFKKTRGGQGHSIKECSGSIYSTGQEEKRSFIKAIQNLKKKIFRELPMVVGEKLLELKQVNLYKHVPIAQKNKLLELMRVKNMCVQYDIHYFSGNDFRTMTSMNFWWKHWYIDEILSLMWESHLRYPEDYDSTDRIIDLNFYTNFKQKCDNISEEATTIGGRSFTRLINEFVWNDDMIDYVRLYPGGMD
ncbi:hypothetical protein KY285_023524 [Solanum tuberosum]|nr:hypothetical protein KY289_023858 [Solanum tuberosum]KAH0675723.1 hypothetical protein KY285_023524 [Solanum tuberosum]